MHFVYTFNMHTQIPMDTYITSRMWIYDGIRIRIWHGYKYMRAVVC